jgi:hypothetical protein
MSLTKPALALCVIAVACDLPPSLTVVPGCDISEETHVYDWYDATESYVFVIDPEVHHMGPEHLARIEASLLEFMRLRVDGHLWVEPFYPYDLAPTVVRVAVIFPDGTSVSTELPDRPPLPSGAEALIDGGIEVWVEDDAWKAWFLDAFALRIHDALTREGSVLSAPVKAATHFAASHPHFAHPQVVVVTSRDDVSERWTGSMRFPWLVVIGAAPNQPSSDGSREPWHFDIQAQLDLNGSTNEAMHCDDGTLVGTFPRALLTSAPREQNTSFFSLCDFDIRDASIPRLAAADGPPPNSIYRPMSLHPDGTVDCLMRIQLPAAGPRRHCADFGFSRLPIEDEGVFPRESCEVPQLTHDDAEGRIGFRYEEAEPTVFRTGQRLVLNTTRLPIGTAFEIRCWRGNDACGFNGNFVDAGARLDARSP